MLSVGDKMGKTPAGGGFKFLILSVSQLTNMPSGGWYYYDGIKGYNYKLYKTEPQNNKKFFRCGTEKRCKVKLCTNHDEIVVWVNDDHGHNHPHVAKEVKVMLLINAEFDFCVKAFTQWGFR